ncbi:hypothetical protein HPO96_32260 [Kribbella sandramycini]|uniref:Uncharacterized protein n=1 Tax=Kribbella sandramycini TaxID=60450 RepID=A0A7Y4L7V8_9ACTN|nr:hypothetical protein [Kribbella sandramycini]MBB6565930.1 hypothetical protein [Kribbella sandramycini]NOL44936.1 hypothetical protein [Kribbella sandramycini]
MSQFNNLVERSFEPPSAARRAFELIVPLALTIRAVAEPTLEYILSAIFVAALCVPLAVAPARLRVALDGFQRKHRVLANLGAAVFVAGCIFILARFALDRPASALIAAVALALALAAPLVNHLRSRR